MAAARAASLRRTPLLTAAAREAPASPAFRFALLPAASAWLLLLWGPARDLPLSLCLGAAGIGHDFGAAIDAMASRAAPARLLGEWALMVAAMMLPLAAPMVGHVAGRSFAVRRTRAALLFLLSYLAIWLAAGPPVLALLLLAKAGLAAAGLGAAAPLIGCGAAALWQASPAKARALNRCHGTIPLRARGAGADLDLIRFGLLHGRRCAASCLPLMLPVMLAGHGPATMALLLFLLLAERAQHRPPLRNSAFLLVLLGVTAAL
jgi:predicted metal-binding membrane protein